MKLKEIDKQLNVVRSKGRQTFLEKQSGNFSHIMHQNSNNNKGVHYLERPVGQANCLTYAPRQAYFGRHKANLSKEPALFQRSRVTLDFSGHILSIQITKTKGEHTTGGLLLYWQTNIFSASYRYQPIYGGRNTNSRTSASPERRMRLFNERYSNGQI